MKNLILIALLVLLMFACKTRQTIPSREISHQVKDSTFTTLTVVDTLQVLRPSDTARISALINKLSEKPLYLKSKQATIKLSKTKDTIQAECICDELKQAVKIYKETITKQREIIDQQKETIQVVTNQLNFFQKVFFWIGIIVVVAILAFVGIKIIKPKFI